MGKPYDPFGYVKPAQDAAREGVVGYGEAALPALRREIGNALGGLNSIGALRSGGADVALNDIAVSYADQIGAYAKQAAGEATGYGLQARQLKDAENRYRDSKKASLFKAIGGVLGAGIGFAVGGPAGAAVGSKAGTQFSGDGGDGGYYG